MIEAEPALAVTRQRTQELTSASAEDPLLEANVATMVPLMASISWNTTALDYSKYSREHAHVLSRAVNVRAWACNTLPFGALHPRGA